MTKNNEVTDADREAAAEILQDIKNTEIFLVSERNEENINRIAQIIADARPEPSPNAETLDSDEVSKIIKEKHCSKCGKHFYWEPYDEVAHDTEADVRIIGQCPTSGCDGDDMVEFIAIEWRLM